MPGCTDEARAGQRIHLVKFQLESVWLQARLTNAVYLFDQRDFPFALTNQEMSFQNLGFSSWPCPKPSRVEEIAFVAPAFFSLFTSEDPHGGSVTSHS